MALFTIDRKEIRRLPHAKDFEAVVKRLGDERADEVREYLDDLIDRRPPDPKTGRRTFSSSYLGFDLSPWPKPLSYLYRVAKEIEGGEHADERAVQDRAALIFGLFIWECVMQRDEEWVMYDPNLPRDPNREIIGKTYFEQ